MDNLLTLIGILILLGVSFWVFNDAVKRNMNAKVWTVLVLLLLIVMLPVYLIVRKPKSESSNQFKNGAFPKNHTNKVNQKKTTMKVMSIIGIVLFSLCLLLMIAFWVEEPADEEAAAGIALWGILYGIALSIVGIVSLSKKTKSHPVDLVSELTKLANLREKGLISEEEFNQQKAVIMNND